MNATGYAAKVHKQLPGDPALWKDALPRLLESVPSEHHEFVKDYLRGMVKRHQVARRESAKPGSLASRRKT